MMRSFSFAKTEPVCLRDNYLLKLRCPVEKGEGPGHPAPKSEYQAPAGAVLGYPDKSISLTHAWMTRLLIRFLDST